MKRLCFALIPAIVVALVAGCGKPAEKKDASPTGGSKPVIGVSLLTLANPFFKEIGDAMTAEAAKSGYEVVVVSGDLDPARQKDQVADFIVKKVAAIVLSPCDSRAIGTSIAEANKAGIPVFTVDIACMDKSAKVVTHIATDNYEGGKLAAKAMIQALKGKGKVAIIDHPEVESVIMRTKGFHEVMKGEKGIQIVAQLPGGAMRDSAYKTAQDILEKNPQLDGIFCINDPTAFGAVAALEKAGRQGKVVVIGFDGQKEAKEAIRDGKIAADSIQFPGKIGTMAVQAIAAYMKGDKVPEQTLIPTSLYWKADALKDPALK